MDTPPRIGHPGRHHHPRQLQRGSQNPGAARKLRVAGWGGKHHAAGRNGGQLHMAGRAAENFHVVGGAARKLLSGRVGRKVGGKLHVAERRKASCSCGWAGGGKFRVAGRGGKLRVAGRDGKRHVAGRAEENVEWLGGVAENFEWPVGKLRRWGGERTSRRGGWGQSHGGGAAENFTSKAEGGEPRANRAHCIICVDFNTAARASTPSQPARARAPPAGSAPSAGLPTLQQKK